MEFESGKSYDTLRIGEKASSPKTITADGRFNLETKGVKYKNQKKRRKQKWALPT